LAIRGPAVGDVEASFRERWTDPSLADQYFWSGEIVRCFAEALAENPQLRLIAVVPRYPDRDGAVSLPPNLVCRQQALEGVRARCASWPTPPPGRGCSRRPASAW
jgi:hypothetical protein